MYKARVQTVSGTKVRADGKWLTCIGNKNVRVGDSIWTDGRCVYGNEETPQQPFVITAPNEEWGIPIQLDKRLFIFRRSGKLEEVGVLPTGQILNDQKGTVYSLNVAAANCSNGNIFTIDTTNATISYYDNDTIRPLDDIAQIWGKTPINFNNIKGLSVDIKKNGTTIKKIPVQDWILNITQPLYSKVQSLQHANGIPDLYNPYDENGIHVRDGVFNTYYPFDIAGSVLFAFIKDNNNWTFTYYIRATFVKARLYCAHGDVQGWGDPPYSPITDMTDGAGHLFYIYYVDSTGKNSIIYKREWLTQSRLISPYDIFSVKDIFIYDNENFYELEKIKFPLQDKFYFKANIVFFDGEKTNTKYQIPPAKHDIYSSDGKLLFSVEKHIGANFVITKLSENKYLAGIKPYIGTYDPIHNDGIYILENGELKILIGEPGDYVCQNYRLRPMKKIKRWWERIQTIE